MNIALTLKLGRIGLFLMIFVIYWVAKVFFAIYSGKLPMNKAANTIISGFWAFLFFCGSFLFLFGDF